MLAIAAQKWMVAAVQTGVQKVLTNDYGLTGVDRVLCGDGNRVSAGTRRRAPARARRP